MSTKPTFKKSLASAPDFAQIDATVARLSEKDNIGSIVRPGDQVPSADAPANVTALHQEKGRDKKLKKSELTAPTHRLPIDLPDYLHRAIKKDAADKGKTAKHIVMRALKDAGYTIRDIDLSEDGRRVQK